MSSVARSCFLQCVKNTHKRLYLPHNEPVFVGRSEETMITDLKLSRKQLKVTANVNKCSVTVNCVGESLSGCNGYGLKKGEIYTLIHGDRLELRLAQHEYDIIFEPPPSYISKNDDEENVEPPPKKLKLNYPLFAMAESSSQSTSKQITDATEILWEDIDSKELLICTSSHTPPQPKIAAFDLDGTIIATKSGARFPKNFDDWIFYVNSVPEKLKELYNENYKLVIFTNQAGIGRGHVKEHKFKKKIENILKIIAVPVQVFVATGTGIYRKPLIGMWKALQEQKNGDISINIKESFYVGDAAGRMKGWAPKKNKDHSIADRLFAVNVGLNFYTPEEYFLKLPPVSYKMLEFDPRDIQGNNQEVQLSDKQEVILMVGSPASGKSHYCSKYIVPNGYVYINRDTLGSQQRCLKLLEDSLRNKQSVVVDNTNPNKGSRQKYIDISKKFDVLCRCFLMSTTFEHAKHNNKFRELTDQSHKKVTDIILNSFKKHYEEPTTDEGFDEIVSINFVPEFDSTENETLYRMFLLES